jgi:hypothetical protein|tara:strand:- start:202 stop:378 length:177 start_codon:yes stop_codon:yes gene_type:complete
MQISKKTQIKLYRAVWDPLMDLRVKNAQGKVVNLDEELFVLENRITKEIKKALNLKNI